MGNFKTMTPHPKQYKRGPYTVEVDLPAGQAAPVRESIPRRNVACKDKLATVPEPGVDTLYKLVQRSSEKYGNAKAIGTRKIIKVYNETNQITKKVDGKEVKQDKAWQYYELGPYEYISASEYANLTNTIGAGLRAYGMVKDDRVHLFASTSMKWLAIAHGASSQSMPIVTAYDSLGEEGLTHSMQQTHAKAIFLDGSLLTKLIKPLNSVKDIQLVIYNKDIFDFNEADVQKLQDAHGHLSIISFDDLVKKGEAEHVEPVPPNPDDLCCIMYTSGSTGVPKGVLLKHKNVIASIAGVDVVVGKYLGPGDGLLTYLPLAHILEFVFENACLHWGSTMGYGHPKTISEANMRNCLGDIREFRPTILVGVPSVFETVKKGVLAKVSKSSALVKHMFWGAMTAKNMMLHSGLPGTGIGTNVVDSVVFSKVKEATGGRIRICMSGGGPIAKETQRFISMAIAPMIIGYGLTETAAMGALMDPLAWTEGVVGAMTGAVEVKLVDCAELGYTTAQQPQQGEVWIRGGSVTDGYLDNPEETAKAFVEGGWFRTGDIGEFDQQGNLKLIDRLKNLVKTLHGEYIALEKLESIYRSTPVVGNICVYAASDKAKPVAIVFPVEAALKNLAQQNGISVKGFDELTHDAKLNAIVLKEMQAQGKTGGLGGIEIIDGVVLTDEEWTPQNGLVTSAQKLNRKAIMDKYKVQIEQAYS